MKLSVQKKHNYYTVSELKNKIMKDKKLHIGDTITYEEFLSLYKEYGQGFTDIEFSKYVLDINDRITYNLKIQKQKITQVFLREIVSEKEIEEIKKEVIEKYDFKPKDKMNYEQLEQVHQIYGGKLNIFTFAEQILNVKPKTLQTVKYSKKSKGFCILKDKGYDEEQVKEIKERIIKESGLHIGDVIDIEQFEKLYNEYGEGISKEIFGFKVLGFQQTVLIPFFGGRLKRVTVFSNYVINPEEIMELRKKVIEQENLHIQDYMGIEEFELLYNKYGGVLSKEIFAEEILDINQNSFRNMREINIQSVILTEIDLPKEYLDFIKKKMIDENEIVHNQQLTLKQLNELYNKYGKVISKNQFITDVLEIEYETYKYLNRGKTQKITILKNTETYNLQELRKRIIKENRLHRDDKINYKKLKRLHEKYGPKIPEYEFARKVLDIEHNCYSGIKRKRTVHTPILYKENNLEFEELEEKVKKIIDNVDYNEQNIQVIRNYILKCKKLIITKEFENEKLDLLEQCILFANLTGDEFEFYCKTCIKLEEFQRAYNFIAKNIENAEIDKKDKEKFRKLQRSIKYTINKQKAMKLIKSGIDDTQQIARASGILEVEAIKLKKIYTKELNINISDAKEQNER